MVRIYKKKNCSLGHCGQWGTAWRLQMDSPGQTRGFKIPKAFSQSFTLLNINMLSYSAKYELWTYYLTTVFQPFDCSIWRQHCSSSAQSAVWSRLIRTPTLLPLDGALTWSCISFCISLKRSLLEKLFITDSLIIYLFKGWHCVRVLHRP